MRLEVLMITQTKAEVDIQSLHEAYLRATGFDPKLLPLDMYRQSVWFTWKQAGLTPEDVVTLVNHHKYLAKIGRPARALHFRNFVSRLDFAQEDLAEIRARQRAQPKQPNKEQVLRESGRVKPDGAFEPEQSVMPKECIQQCLAQLKQAAGMK